MWIVEMFGCLLCEICYYGYLLLCQILHTRYNFALSNSRSCFSVASVVVRTPQKTLTGHNNAVTAAEWLSGGTQCVTASWDRTARIWDSEAGTAIHSLTGQIDEFIIQNYPEVNAWRLTQSLINLSLLTFAIYRKFSLLKLSQSQYDKDVTFMI